jgi:hypothetical protein
MEWPLSAQPGRPDARRRGTGIHPELTYGAGTKRQILSTRAQWRVRTRLDPMSGHRGPIAGDVGGCLRLDLGDHPAQANAVTHAPSHYDPLKTEWSQPEVAAG